MKIGIICNNVETRDDIEATLNSFHIPFTRLDKLNIFTISDDELYDKILKYPEEDTEVRLRIRKIAEERDFTEDAGDTEKPPIGLVSKFIRQAQRLEEVCRAMARYYEAGMEIPVEWTEECAELADSMTKKSKEGPPPASRW